MEKIEMPTDEFGVDPEAEAVTDELITVAGLRRRIATLEAEKVSLWTWVSGALDMIERQWRFGRPGMVFIADTGMKLEADVRAVLKAAGRIKGEEESSE